MAILIFPLLPLVSRAAEIPDAVIERALQTPGADASTLQLVEANSPFQYGYGTYWSVQKDPWPPLPFNWLADQDGISVYSAGQGVYLVDDRAFDYETEALAQTIFTALEMDGGGGDGGTPMYATNDLWIELVSTSILSPTNLSATLLVHTPEVQGVYDLFFKRSLSPSNLWYWVARGLPGQTNFYLVNLPVDGGFFILGSTNFTDTNRLTAAYRGLIGGVGTLTNDFDNDGLSDAWEINFFGDLSQSPFADYDGDGVSNYTSYTNANFGDPNKIQFLLNFPAERVNSSAILANLMIRAGNPAYFSVLVNNTNQAAANWQLFNSTNVAVNLNAGDGRYDVQIGLRGRAIGAAETWLSARLTLDTVPPVIAITNLASSSVVSRPLIEIQGWANEPVSRVSFDITNSTGLQTNLAGYITGQFADTNLLDFTTNYFQCYNVALVEGTNRITLRVTDLAGNSTSTNLTVKLDYSTESSPPVLTQLWPLAGTQIAGDSLTVQARVDNPTATVEASIVDSAGNTNTVRGIVERNGLVWAKNLRLAAGTNTLILTATTAAGSTSATSASIVHSSVSVAMDTIPTNQLNKVSINLTGSVSDSSAGVWVNGVQASVGGSGNWAATNVPASPSGTAVFDVEVFAPGSGPPSGVPIGSLQVDQPQPAHVVLMSYSGYRDIRWSILDACYPLDNGYEYGDDVRWSYNQGGFYRQWQTEDKDQQNPPFDYTNPLSAGQGSIAPAWEIASVSDGMVGPVTCGHQWLTEARRTETRVMVEPEGQASIGESTVYLVRAKALQFTPPSITDPLYTHAALMSGSYSNYAGTIPVSPDTLQINGVTLANTGETDADGSTWGATLVGAPAGVRPELKLAANQVQGYKDLTFDAKVESVKLRIFSGTNDVTDKTTAVLVGEKIGLRCVASVTNTTPTNYQWTVPGVAISNYAANVNSGTVYSNFSAVNSNIDFYWVDGATNRQVQCSSIMEGRTLSGKTVFNIQRPNVQMTAQVTGTITADTNFIANFQQQGNWTWLHLGGTLQGTNIIPGVRFRFSPDTSGDYAFVQVGSSSATIAAVNGTNYNYSSFGVDNGVDTNDFRYPLAGDASPGWYFTDDSPANYLASVYTNIARQDSFTMYLMFQPDVATGKTLVPLKKVNWSWSATAVLTNSALNLWSITSASAPTAISFTDTAQHPTWTNHLQPVQWSPHDPPLQ